MNIRGEPATSIVVGAGNRYTKHTTYSFQHLDTLKIVDMVYSHELRRYMFTSRLGLSLERCYESAEGVAWQDDYLFASAKLAENLVDCYTLGDGAPDPQSLSNHYPIVTDFEV